MILSASGTKTPTVSGAATFSTSVPTVTFNNNAAAGDIVVFSGATAPTGVNFFQPYYILATGLSSTGLQFAATPGGTAIQATATGSGVVATISHVLAVDTTPGVYVAKIETSAMTYGDLAQTQLWTTTLAGGNPVVEWEASFGQPQIANSKPCPMVVSDILVQVTLSQPAGTARAFPWKLIRM